MIREYQKPDVDEISMIEAMENFKITKNFPAVEKYSLAAWMRRSSCSACGDIARTWRRQQSLIKFQSKTLTSRPRSSFCSSEALERRGRRISIKNIFSKDIFCK